MKKILNISFSAVLMTVLAVLLSFTAAKHKHLPCSDVIISLDRTGHNDLLCQEEIRSLIPGDTNFIKGKPCSEICIEEIASHIASNPYVEDCDVCLTVNGILKVDVRQRIPLARVFNRYGDPTLMDINGKILPVKDVALDLPVVSGYIDERYKFTGELYYIITPENSPLLDGLRKLCHALRADEFLSSLIDQVYVNEEGEIELIPKVGRQVVILGNLERMDQKLLDLKDTYRTVLPAKGWDVYKTINLKYENQIICSK